MFLVVAIMSDGVETAETFADPEAAARTVVAGIRSNVLLRVKEYSGTAAECEAYASETWRLTQEQPFEAAWSA